MSVLRMIVRIIPLHQGSTDIDHCLCRRAIPRQLPDLFI